MAIAGKQNGYASAGSLNGQLGTRTNYYTFRQGDSMTQKARFTFTISVLVVLLLSAPLAPPVHAGGVGVFATEPTQLLNNIQLLKQSFTQLQQLQTQLQQYENMVRNSTVAPTQVFGDVMNDLNRLAQVVQTGQALSYSMANLDSQFRTTFPGYTLPGNGNFAHQYKNCSQATLDTQRSTLAAAGLQGSQLQSEQSVLDALQQMSRSSSGRLEAIQIGNQISEQQVEQLMKLRQLMIADLQSKQAFHAAQVQKDIDNQNLLDQGLHHQKWPVGSKSY